ncbi:MAG: UDP-N-acetylglucosamine pyrophosphorylase [Clostridia bacterium]|nr:UDP-N-acetylglucosamine pyrophosphorylase [Clostridia bacterium]
MVKTKELFATNNKFIKPFLEKFEYPWEALPEIKNYLKALINDGVEGYTLIDGNILMGENVKIAPTAYIEGPAIIGANTEIRPGAYIRGSVIIGEKCVIGNSTELKNAILCDGVQVPHYNYVGDSVLGDKAHLGAGAICSNFKGDGSNVTVRGDQDYATGLRKLGAILGDRADIGCGCVLNPGTVIGKDSRAYPLNSLRGVYPENAIIKSNDNIVEKK